MRKLFLWLNYHNGDLILSRPLVREILTQHDNVEIAWGCWKNQAYLVEDLPVRVISDAHSDRPFWDPPSLMPLCPPDHIPIYLWIAKYPDTRFHLWECVVEVYNRQVREHGHKELQISSRWVPMVDFPAVPVEVAENAIFVENSKPRAFHSNFYFDLGRMAKEFPEFTFYCSADPGVQASNVVNVSKLNLVQLSSVSNRCVAIMGIGSGPFVSTLTEHNRYKPRAIMRFHPPQAGHVLWNYPGNPMQYLETQAELSRFLQTVRRLEKTRLLPGKPLEVPAYGVAAETAAANLDLQLQRIGRTPGDGPMLPRLRPVRDALMEFWRRVPENLLEYSHRGAWGKTQRRYLELRSRALREGESVDALPPADMTAPADGAAAQTGGTYGIASVRHLLAAMLNYSADRLPMKVDLRMLPDWLRGDFMTYGMDRWSGGEIMGIPFGRYDLT